MSSSTSSDAQPREIHGVGAGASTPSTRPPTPPGPVSPLPPRRYKVDSIAGALAGGARPATWGLNLSAHQLAPETLRAPYTAFHARAVSALSGTGAYVYPFEYLHITAASPAPFTHTTLSPETDPEEVGAFEAAVLRVLREQCVPGRDGFPSQPFPLIYENPRLEAAAGFFLVTDPTGGVARVRKAIRRCLDSPDLAPYLDKAQPRVPGIVHSTFIRFAAPPDEGVTDEDVAARFEELAKTWEPVTVLADALVLVREIVPYMHLELHQGGRNQECAFAYFPYGPE
jgi:hypothetical protein